MNIRKHGFSTSLSSARPGSDDSTGPPALRCPWTTVTDSELRLHRTQVGSLSRMFFCAFVRKIPMGYGMTHAAAHGDFSIGVSGKYTLTRSWLLLRRRILLPVRFLSHTGSDFLSQRPCYGNADLIAEPAFPYSVFRRLPARKNGQQSFYPLLPVHELTKACAFRLVNLYRWLTCSFCF